MTHLYRVTEWQSGNRWRVANTDDLTNPAIGWWVPMRLLTSKSSLAAAIEPYLLLLKNKYHVTDIYFNPKTNVFDFTWTSYADAHKYLLDVNRCARRAGMVITRGNHQ